MLEAGGFDEMLYPNEENALMDALVARGAHLLYDPGMSVQRRPRPGLRAFARMVFTYGRGRAEQFRLHPTAGSAANLVPPLFCLYLALLPVLGPLGMGLLGLYLVALLGQGILSARDHGLVRALLSLPLVVLTHIGYGLGFWRGLFTRVERNRAMSAEQVVIERITPGLRAPGGAP